MATVQERLAEYNNLYGNRDLCVVFNDINKILGYVLVKCDEPHPIDKILSKRIVDYFSQLKFKEQTEFLEVVTDVLSVKRREVQFSPDRHISRGIEATVNLISTLIFNRDDIISE